MSACGEAIRRQALLLSRHPTCAAAADVEGIAGELNQLITFTNELVTPA